MAASLPLAVHELRAQENDVHARLKRARTALSEAKDRFLRTGAEADRRARIAADAELQAAKDDYDGVRQRRDRAEHDAVRSMGRTS